VKVFRAALAASLLALPVVLSAQDVKTDFDKTFNFSAVKTFAIKIGTTWGNELSERRVLAEFDQAIAGKGWKKVDEAQADIVVILHGSTQAKHSASTFYMGGGGYYPYRYGGMGMQQTVVNEYTVGTLVVDMFDAKTKNLVFKGTASDEISDSAEKNQKKVVKASEKMFKDFPPKEKKK
jgi:hypothetical protein